MRRDAHRGFTIIEAMIAVALVAIVLGLAAPAMTTWINNAQISTAADSIVNGIQLARAEAVRRNTFVRFQLTSSNGGDCGLTDQGVNWVVSLYDTAGQCDAATDSQWEPPPGYVDSPGDNPRIIQKRAGNEGTPTVTIRAQGASTVTFNNLGRVVDNKDGSPSITRIDVDSSAIDPADSRDLRVIVGAGGAVRVCDPNADVSKPTACGDI